MKNSKDPMVSVMILCYNYADMLKKALAACAAQTFRDFEIVMINNNSTDDTEQVWLDFCAAHPELRTVYVHVTDSHDALNGWNRGLEAASGTYILFNDADDWMEPDCLELLAAKAAETGADRVAGGYQEVLPDGTVTRRRLPARGTRLLAPMLQGMIFRREIIERHSLFYSTPYFVSHDVWYLYSFALHETTRAQSVDKVIYDYYYNPRSVTQSINSAQKRYETTFKPFIEFTRQLSAQTADEELKTEMQYLLLRNLFASCVSTYLNADVEEADAYYLQIHQKLNEALPGYYKNRLLWKLNNGYERGGTVGCMAVALLDRCKAKGLIRLLALCGQNNKMVRKDVHAAK